MLSSMSEDLHTLHTREGSILQGYHSYLLRLWRAQDTWHASLEDSQSGKRLAFANLEQLFVHLMSLAEDKVNTTAEDGGTTED